MGRKNLQELCIQFVTTRGFSTLYLAQLGGKDLAIVSCISAVLWSEGTEVEASCISMPFRSSRRFLALHFPVPGHVTLSS